MQKGCQEENARCRDFFSKMSICSGVLAARRIRIFLRRRKNETRTLAALKMCERISLQRDD
jgi:hypothetical protein